MTDLYIEGPDVLKLLSAVGINTFKNFAVNKAKQFVACNYDGYVIGDVILFGLEPNVFNLVGRPSVHNWVQYNCETGGYNAKVTRDERAAVQKGPVVRKAYRYQVQGPNAMKLMDYYYDPKPAAMLAEYINYITPVPACKDVILQDAAKATKKSDQKYLNGLASSPLVFPTSEMVSKVHNYRVLDAAEEKQWNALFEPIYQS